MGMNRKCCGIEFDEGMTSKEVLEAIGRAVAAKVLTPCLSKCLDEMLGTDVETEVDAEAEARAFSEFERRKQKAEDA
jgi:hypothetical protein